MYIHRLVIIVSGGPVVAQINLSTKNRYLKVNAVIQIYTGSPTIYLVGYCLGSAATVQTINSLSHFTYTRK